MRDSASTIAPTARTVTPELMDQPGVPRDQLARALRYIRGVNKVLGGVSSLLSVLRADTAGWRPGDTRTLLDVGTGSADLPLAAVRWAASRGLTLRVLAVDKHAGTLELARQHVAREGGEGLRDSITLRQADALHLTRDFQPGSFDYVHAGLFLHHLSDAQAIDVLRQMGVLARRRVIWNDLVRTRTAQAAITLATIGQPRIVRHDARVSVRAGFTRSEAMALAARADLTDVRYDWSVLTHRFVLSAVRNAVRTG